LDKLIVYQ